MSSSIYIPSSSSGGGAVPSGVSVKTASYTIPAGKYASAIPTSIKCTIDGSESFLYLTRTFTANISFSGTRTALYYLANESFEGKITSGVQNMAKNVVLVSQLFPASFNASGAFRSTISRVTGTTAISVYVEKGVISGTGMQNPIIYSDGSGTDYSALTIQNTALYGYQEINGSNLTWNVFSARALDQVMVPAGTVLSGGNWIVTEYNV